MEITQAGSEAFQNAEVVGSESTSSNPVRSSSHANLNPRSCVTCRRRKVRCNKENPCSNCARAGIECIFPGPGRAPRKSRKPADAELLARLRRLEGVVHSLGAQVDENGMVLQSLPGPADSRPLTSHGLVDSPPSDRPETKRRSIDRNPGRLMVSEDRSRYVSNAFWASMSDEVHLSSSSTSSPLVSVGSVDSFLHSNVGYMSRDRHVHEKRSLTCTVR